MPNFHSLRHLPSADLTVTWVDLLPLCYSDFACITYIGYLTLSSGHDKNREAEPRDFFMSARKCWVSNMSQGSIVLEMPLSQCINFNSGVYTFRLNIPTENSVAYEWIKWAI